MLYWSYFFIVFLTVPGRWGGFYSQGRDFSSVFAATSAVMFFHAVDACCYSLTFSSLFCFVGYVRTLVCCCISLLNKRGASSEHAIANFVSVLLSRRGKLYAVNFTTMGKV